MKHWIYGLLALVLAAPIIMLTSPGESLEQSYGGDLTTGAVTADSITTTGDATVGGDLTVGGTITSTPYNLGTASGAQTVDFSLGGFQQITLANTPTVISFTNVVSVGGGMYTLLLRQDGTGGRTVTWPSNVKWSYGTAPTLTTAASAVDIFQLIYNGTNFYGTAVFDLK